MKVRFLILAVLFAWLGKDGIAQQKTPVSSEQEDCGVTFNFTTASSGAQAAGTVTAGSTGTTAVIDNRQSACVYWKVAYSPNSTTASVSLAFQTALDVGGVPTTWSNYPGTLDSGINPNTAVTTGGARTEASGVEYPFLRMNMTVITGAGARVQGKLTGWKSRPPITANAVIAPGSLCTAGAPCPVDGPNADGTTPTFPPVLVAGYDDDNGVVKRVRVDSVGDVFVIGTGTNGAVTVEGPGLAGAPSGLVLTVQGDPAGTPIPVAPSGVQDVNVTQYGNQPVVNTGLDGVFAVGGAEPVGTTPSSNPVFFAGIDPATGTLTTLKVDSNGLYIQGFGTPGSPANGLVTVQGDPAGTPIPVAGTKTNDAAAPGTNNVGVLPCLATAAAPSFTEGNMVTCSTDLAGNQRVAATVIPAGTQDVNLTQVLGTATDVNNGTASAGSQRGTVASNNSAIANWGHGAIAAAPPVNATYTGGLNSGATGGLLGGMPICDSFYNINIATATTTLAITGVAGRHVRICHINMVAGAAQAVAIISGTGGTCGTGTAAIVGTSTATGYQWAAQTGISAGSGLGTIMRTVAAGDSVCLITSTTGQLSGVISYSIY